MKTRDASLPAPLPSADMTLGDEAVFHYRDTDGQEVETRVPIALGLLLAANAVRAGESFALGYPGDPVGAIARSGGGRLFVHRDAAATLSGMQAFLERYSEALLEQAAAPAADVAAAGDAGSAPPQVENISPSVG